MTQEQIKAKAKEYFPNDEFKQQIVIDAINWATKELEKENAELKADNAEWEKASDKWKNLYNSTNNQLTKAKEIIQEFLELNYSEFTKTNAVFLHADKFLKE